MNKKFFAFVKPVAVAISVIALTACGGNATTQEDAKTAATATFPVTIMNNGADLFTNLFWRVWEHQIVWD